MCLNWIFLLFLIIYYYHEQENSPSPTADVGLSNGVTPIHNHESSLTSEEDAAEALKSLPPYLSCGRDSITQLSNTHHLRSSTKDKMSPEDEVNPADALLLLTPNNNKVSPSANLLHSTSKIVKNNNELNSTRHTNNRNGNSGNLKYQNSMAVPVLNNSTNPDTNANLPKPDITSCVDIQPKIPNNKGMRSSCSSTTVSRLSPTRRRTNINHNLTRSGSKSRGKSISKSKSTK